MNLIAQQRAFAALLDADEPGTGTALLRATAGRPARLDVYHHAYRARLAEALRSNYPVLHRVLGDQGFSELAAAYLDDHPSRHPSIRWFGHQLPAWAELHPAALPHPSLADLAAMEWTLGLSFDAADATPLAFEDLAALPAGDWPDARFAAPRASAGCMRWNASS